MRQNFKFGRTYDVNKFTLFDPKYYDEFYNIDNFPRVSAHYSPCGTNGTSGSSGSTPWNTPQKAMSGIKKFYHKGKYPKPRNT